MSFWWVNHKQTFDEEFKGGFIWSPQQNKNGGRNESYINLTKTGVGDTVFSYAGGKIQAFGRVIEPYRIAKRPASFGATGEQWDKNGWLVPIRWTALPTPLSPKDHLAEIVPLLPGKHSPIQENGNGNQSIYLAAISDQLGNKLLSLITGITNRNIDQPAEVDPAAKEVKVPSNIPLPEYLNIGRALIFRKVGEEIPPVMGVESLAAEMALLIDNLKSAKGQMIGIFGRWGRGKTFFME